MKKHRKLTQVTVLHNKGDKRTVPLSLLVEFAVFNQDVLSHNLFGYCENEPVGKYDVTGYNSLALSFSVAILAELSAAVSSIFTGISTSIASIKAALATSWFIPLCIAAAAIAIIGIIYVVNKVISLMASAKIVISAVKANLKKGGYKLPLGGYTVYVIVRKGTFDVVYVGITKRYSTRKRQHTGKGKRFPTSKYTMTPVESGLSKSKARALEQTLITAYSLDTLKNMINSISPKKWNDFKIEFKQMQTLIQSWRDPE